ncbi:MAG: hypothetical protein R3B90_15370 [Planctomycetaceae bacterium]
MTVAGLLLLGVGGMWGLGIAAACLLLCRSVDSSRPAGNDLRPPTSELLGTGLVLGVGVTAWGEFLWSWAGGQFGWGNSIAFAGVGCAAGAAALWFHRLQRVVTGDRSVSRLAGLCRLLVVVLFINLLAQSLLTPQRLWDERAIYAIKAKVLYHDRTIDSPDLRNPDFVQYHPRYPLLLPIAEQHLYQLLGEANDRWAKIIPPLLYLGLTLAFAGVLTRHFGAATGWVFAVALATIPSLMPWEYGFLTAQADAPVAALHGLAALYLWDSVSVLRSQLQLPAARLVLAGLFAGLCLFTKDEGISFALAEAALLPLIVLPVVCHTHVAPGSGKLSRGCRVAAFHFAVAVIAAPWFWHRRTLPLTTEMSYFSRLSFDAVLAGLPTLTWSIPHLCQRMFLEARTWGLHWWGVLLAIGFAPRRLLSAPQLLVLLDVVASVAALLLAGMLSPTAVEEHIGGSAHRYLIQITPLAILLMAGQLGAQPQQRSAC